MDCARSALYTGRVRHRRYRTSAHEFSYSAFMVYVDLQHSDELFGLAWLWNTHRALVQFRREDYLPGHADLATEVRDTVENALGQRPLGRICVLTNPRIYGYLINPITVFYCFEPESDALQALVLEVTNTPWKERTRYVLACDPGRRSQRIQFDKTMHVSPFLPMKMQYLLTTQTPDKKIALHLQNFESSSLAFDATLALQRQAGTPWQRIKVLLLYPWMTLKVFAAIHWQALRLYLKKVPIVPHPNRPTTKQDTP